MKLFLRLLTIVSVLALSVIAFAEGPQTARFTSSNRQVSYEIFGPKSAGPVIIMLHGASGPDIPLYRNVAQTIASNDYTVFFLHYFDATDTMQPSPENYRAWEKSVGDLVDECRKNSQWSGRKIGIIGFSLGASVALAAGSQMVPISALVEWYGSLPDEFFYQLKGMAPLLILHGARDGNIPIVNAKQLIQLCQLKRFTCENHIYSDQGHGFIPPAYDDAIRRTLDFFSRYLK